MIQTLFVRSWLGVNEIFGYLQHLRQMIAYSIKNLLLFPDATISISLSTLYVIPV